MPGVCPKCGFPKSENAVECSKCGIVFEKFWERIKPAGAASNTVIHEKKIRAAFLKTLKLRLERLKPNFKKRPTGEKIQQSEPPPDSVSYFFSGLFDISFKKLITPAIVKANYGFCVILGMIATLIYFFKTWTEAGFLKALLGPLVYILTILLIRIWSEFMIIAFKIEANTQKENNPEFKKD